jgi:hypothetical protein
LRTIWIDELFVAEVAFDLAPKNANLIAGAPLLGDNADVMKRDEPVISN